MTGTKPPTATQAKSGPGTAGCGFNGAPSGGRGISVPLELTGTDVAVVAGPVAEEATGYRIDGRTITTKPFPERAHLPAGRYFVYVAENASPGTDRTDGYPVDSSGQRAPEQDFD